jgi:hypothetical protein
VNKCNTSIVVVMSLVNFSAIPTEGATNSIQRTDAIVKNAL